MNTPDLEKLIAQATPLPFAYFHNGDVWIVSNKNGNVAHILKHDAFMEGKEVHSASLIAYAVNSILPMSRRCDKLTSQLTRIVRLSKLNAPPQVISNEIELADKLLSQIESEK